MTPSTIHTLNGNGTAGPTQGRKRLSFEQAAPNMSPSYQWINIPHIGESELQYLEKFFHIHALDLKDCLPPLQRPKAIAREQYIFGLFVFPLFNEKTREIDQYEVDMCIGGSFLITVHNNESAALRNFYELLEMNAALRSEFMNNPVRFVAQCLDELLDSCFPMLFHISNDIDVLRLQVLHGFSEKTVHEILRLKNNIVAFRKTMQPHRDLLKRLLEMLPRYMEVNDTNRSLFTRLIDHTKEIWDHLETYQSAIDAVEDTHSTLLSFRLNQIMKTFTIFSSIMLALSFVANLFIIDGVSRPIVGLPYDWWAIVGLMTLGALGMIGIFKKKRWL